MIYFKCVKVKLKLYLFIRASHRRQELSWTPHLLALIPSIVPMPLIKQIFQKIFILWSGGANVDTCIMWALQRSTGEADGDICRCDLSAARCESGRQGHGQGRVLQTRCTPLQTADCGCRDTHHTSHHHQVSDKVRKYQIEPKRK